MPRRRSCGGRRSPSRFLLGCWRFGPAPQPRPPKRAASKLAAPRLVLELSAISVSPWTRAVSMPAMPPRMADSDEFRSAVISSERALNESKAALPAPLNLPSSGGAAGPRPRAALHRGPADPARGPLRQPAPGPAAGGRGDLVARDDAGLPEPGHAGRRRPDHGRDHLRRPG